MAHAASRHHRYLRGLAAIAAAVAVGVLGLSPASAATPAVVGSPLVSQVATSTASTIVRKTPSIGGSLTVGSRLTAYVGTFTPSDAKVSYQWYSGGAKVSGATGKYFTLTGAQVGESIVVRVQLAKTGYTTSVRWGKRDGAVTAPAIVRKTPSIGGAIRSGSQLTAYVGAYSPSSARISYQWYVGGSKVDGATGKYFTPLDWHIGHRVSVRVTLSADGYAASTAWANGSTEIGWQRAALGGDGMYRVGIDIAPGVYYAPDGGLCYWERSAGASGSYDDIIANDFGEGQRMVQVLDTDAYFVTDGCGSWYRFDGTTYDTANDYFVFGDEVVAVGYSAHVLPGLYRSEGNEFCYWARLTRPTGEIDDIIVNDIVDGAIEVRLDDGEFFESAGCNIWTRVD